MIDVIHFTMLADDPIGRCGKWASLCTDNWDKVTCQKCLEHRPAETCFDAKINTAISENFPMFFQRHGLWTVELRAVSYTFENGNSRTRLLRTFDIREEIEKIIALWQELKKRLPAVIAPDIAVLESFFWDGVIEKPISRYVQEFSNGKRAEDAVEVNKSQEEG